MSLQLLGFSQSQLGNLEQALEYYQQYNQLTEELYNDFPNNVEFKNGLAYSYYSLAQYHQQKQDITQARLYFEKAEQHWAALVQLSPNYVDFSHNLEVVREILASL
ncbi:MAG: hypothetical protein AB8G11_03505 [Saprospiraceae bacterium]